jgi:hypothetical protein
MAVLSILRRGQRWMQDGATEVALPETSRYKPRVLARPAATAYVANGGVVYPWDA